METAAIKKFFGARAYELLISSTKGATGHLLGATGAVEAAICAKTIETSVVAPTINYATVDPACDLNYIPNRAIRAEVRHAISENMGFGGQNAALMFRKFPQ
jgi:3-oxoacyl-(acyl-carrier-protein) synthase